MPHEQEKGEIENLILPEYNQGKEAHLIKYKDYVFITAFKQILKQIPTFAIRDDDIWVVSYPKSGTTWIQEIVYLIMNGVDEENASKTTIDVRFPYFEYTTSLESVASLPSPRLIKSHLPISLLPSQIEEKKPKIIYIARNPKDIVNSYFIFMIKFLKSIPFNGSYEDFCRLFVEDKVFYGPWWKHISEAWKRKDDGNILFLFYEDLHENYEKQVRTVAKFLQKSLTDEQVEKILKHCSFESMKNNSSVNYDWFKTTGKASKDTDFLRKGKVGDWKNHLSKDIVRRLDEMVATKIPQDVPIRDSLPEVRQMSRL